MVLPTWVRPLGPQVLTSCCHGSKDLDLSALRQQILSSKRPASEKADSFLLERSVNDLSKDQWQNLIVGIPKDVKKEIGMSKSADRIKLNGKIAVLEGGDLETGKRRLLSLFRRGDDASDLQKDGQPAGRLLLININNMVSTETAKVEVLGAKGNSMGSFLPEDDGNGLSEDLFVFNTVIRVLPFTDKWWQQVWTFFAAKGVALLSLVVAMLALALHWKRSKTGNTTVNIVVIALPPFVTSVYQYRVLILLWETDRGVSFGRHVYFVSCTIEYAAHAK